MRFLVDRCAGYRLTLWLRAEGHDAVDARDIGEDPGDEALLERASEESRALITLDKDFGELIYLRRSAHSGLIRLPDVPMARRITLLASVIAQHSDALEEGAVVTAREENVRVSHPPLA